MKRLRLLLLFLVLGVLRSQSQWSDVTASDMRDYVRILTSDSLEGRRAGSAGADKAAAYLAARFRDYGLEPLGPGGTYFQPFEFVSGVRLGADNSLAIRVPSHPPAQGKLGTDFRPLGFSSSGTFEGSVVFAGYGLNIASASYDDFADVDVTNKAVILFRDSPPFDSAGAMSGLSRTARYKATKARDRGAKLVIFVSAPGEGDDDRLMPLTYDQSSGSADIMALSVTRGMAEQILGRSGNSLSDLQKKISSTKKPASFDVPDTKIVVTISVNSVAVTSSNVVGYIKSLDTSLAGEIIVIGAHYDHLGFGGEGSGSLQPDTVAVHHGADDNASGTAGLLELAQHFSAHRAELKRSMIFVAFTGEEEGLLGSGYYVKHSPLPLSRTVAMLNMDMIGRLTDRTLVVYGTGTSPGFDSLVRLHNRDSVFSLKLNPDGFAPSDQSSFYAAQIPVLEFFTNLHSDYHKPADTYDKLNYDGMEKIVRLVGAIAGSLGDQKQRPAYAAMQAPRPPAGASRGYRVATGVIPDFGEQVEGMKISGVREGGPAARAGLQGGDVIVKFGSMEIKNLYDYTYALGEHKPGDTVEVVVRRNGKTLTLTLTLDARK